MIERLAHEARVTVLVLGHLVLEVHSDGPGRGQTEVAQVVQRHGEYDLPLVHDCRLAARVRDLRHTEACQHIERALVERWGLHFNDNSKEFLLFDGTDGHAGDGVSLGVDSLSMLGTVFEANGSSQAEIKGAT